MKKLRNWSISLCLALPFGLVLVSVATASPAIVEDQKTAAEWLVVGPIPLSELFQHWIDGEADQYVRAMNLDRAELLKELEKCRLYLVDRRTKDRQGRWVFADGQPKIVLEGPCKLVLKDKDKKDFKLHVIEMTRQGSNTFNYWKGDQNPEPPHRHLPFRVDMDTSPYQLRLPMQGGGEMILGPGFMILTVPLRYDVFGKWRWLKNT
jgi:hypothetical protein